MGQALSISKVLNAKFHTLEVDGEWYAAIGQPELTGSWMIYGAPKNGKTTFAMMLAKYLSKFVRVAYDSVEEGLSQSVQMAMERVGMKEVSGRVVLLDKEPIADLVKRLHRQKSPDVVIIDSVQFLDPSFSEYKKLNFSFCIGIALIIISVVLQTWSEIKRQHKLLSQNPQNSQNIV